MKRAAPVFTNLGMHFVAAGSDVVLVQIEVNVRGLLAVHARRLIKSKRGVANVSFGTVRLTVATPDDQEKANRAHVMATKCDDYDRMAEQNINLHAENGLLRQLINERNYARESHGSGI